VKIDVSHGIIKKIGGAFGFENEETEVFNGLAPVTRPQLKIAVYKPKEFEDVREIADALLARSAVLLHLENAGNDLARRMIDYMNGIGYAVSAKAEKITGDLIIYVPENAAVEKEPLRAVKSSKWF
jgi:FtsZ-interacting cell division protein YlmF